MEEQHKQEVSEDDHGQQEVMRGEPEIVRLIHMGETEAVLDLIRSARSASLAGAEAGTTGTPGTPGLDPNYKAAGGWSLLHMAALGDMVEVVAALVEAGADVESEDHGGLRPLHYAASWDAQAALAELATRRGASLDCTSKDQLFYLNKIIPVFVVGGRTPLHLAVDKGYYECAKLLLEAGADASVFDWSGRTAYDLAVNNDRLDMASLLRPGVTEHVSAVPKNFHFDRRGVETRLGRKAPLPSLRPIPATGDNSADEPSTTTTTASAAAAPELVSSDPGPAAAPRPVPVVVSGGGGTSDVGSGGRLTTLNDMLRQAHALLVQAQQQQRPGS